MPTKVTLQNVIFLANDTVICPLSSNKYSQERHFTVDANRLHLVLGRTWSVLNDSSHRGNVHLNIRSWNRTTRKVELLHRILFADELQGSKLTVDHLLHWTDNRRVSVDLVPIEENVRRGKAVYNPQNRRSRR